VRIATGDDTYVVEVLPETPSTNAVLAQRAREGAPEGLVIATEHQTAGRGRLDRTWETPPHAALTFSALLRPPAAQVPPQRWPWLPLLAGLAVTSALREEGYAAAVKWPNDVLVGDPAGEGLRDGKVAGILLERVTTADGRPLAVIGIGINVAQTAFPPPIQDIATSLSLLSARDIGRERLLAAVLAALETELERLRARGLAGVAEALAPHDALRDRRLKIGAHQGRGAGIDATGQLRLRLDDGREQLVASGHVELLPEA